LEQAASAIAGVNDAAHRNDVDATIAALSEFSRIVGEAEEKARKRKKAKSLERRRALYAAKKSAGTLPKRKTKRDLETERIHDLADAEFHRSRYGEPEGLSPWAELQ
jgi:hypothetical protein